MAPQSCDVALHGFAYVTLQRPQKDGVVGHTAVNGLRMVSVINGLESTLSVASDPGIFNYLYCFYSAPQSSHCKRCTSYSNSVRLSVRPSVRLSVTGRYCVKTTARSMVQFALSDSKMCLVL